jgi:Uncharacterised nucleotidyltransferase
MTSARGSAAGPEFLRQEASLLLALAVPRWEAASQVAADQRLAAEVAMDWPYFLDQALRQQVISMIGRNLARYLPKDKRLVQHPWIYSAAYEANSRRNKSLFAEFGRILRALSHAGVPHAVRKGPALCSLVYEDPGVRRMSDLDILVDRASLDTIGTALTELGYSQGVLSGNGCCVLPYERKTELFWAVHMNNALPFRKPATDPEVQSFEVDLCFDLFQKKSAGQADVRTLLDNSRSTVICGEPSFALNPLDQLLDICLHLYKEATSYLSISQGRDIILSRFIDVVESIRVTAPSDLAMLPDYVRKVGAVREVYFALFHASLLYSEGVPAELVADLRPQDRDYLDEYGQLEGRTRRWNQGFLDRLFNPNRALELPGASSIPTT